MQACKMFIAWATGMRDASEPDDNFLWKLLAMTIYYKMANISFEVWVRVLWSNLIEDSLSWIHFHRLMNKSKLIGLPREVVVFKTITFQKVTRLLVAQLNHRLPFIALYHTNSSLINSYSKTDQEALSPFSTQNLQFCTRPRALEQHLA